MATPTLTAPLRDLVASLHHEAEAADGHPSLNEAVWRDLDRPRPESAGVLLLAGGRPAGYVHVARSDSFSAPHWAVGFVTRPQARSPGLGERLLDLAAAHAAAHGGGRLTLWVLGATPELDPVVTAAGFAPDRELLELRAPLPLALEARWPDGYEQRTFVAGADDDAWLVVNNRAFGNHPEQGGWVRETLERRLGEPWFDPGLFLLAVDGDGIAGFNWLKVHEGRGGEPDLGEIFVIGVDPRAQDRGLGRALAVAGLERLAARGIRTAMLFVAAENTAARALYADLGFRVHRTDRAYTRTVAPT